MKLSSVLFFSVCAAGALPLHGQGLPVPEIRPRMEYEFQTAVDAVYLVEATKNGQSWEAVAGPIFGDGKPARALMPAAAADFRQFRVRLVPAAEVGPATTALGGKTLSLNDHGKVRQIILFPPIQGVTRGILKTDASHARSLIWRARRTSGSGVSLELQFFDGTGSGVDLTFSNGQLGSYQMRDRNLTGAVQEVEEGIFSVHGGRIRDNPDQAVVLSVLTGQSLAFEEGGALTRMDFSTNGNVTLTNPDGSTRLQQFSYEVKSPVAAELRLSGADQPPQLYQMLLDSQATGTFNRLPLNVQGGFPVPGALPQPGTFNVPTGPVFPNSTIGPPKSLEGKVIQIQGDDPVTLTFNGDGTGTATRQDNGSVELEPFTYDYSPTDDDEASLALTYPGAQTDRVEDYDLDFSGTSTGSFRGSIFVGGELARSTSGIFNSGGS